VLGLALAYGGVAQILAGMWEFRTGNTFGAVAFTSFGAFWISFWAFVTFFEGDVPAANVGDAVGPYLIAWGIFTTYMASATRAATKAWSKSAAGSAWRRRRLPGMHLLRRSSIRPSGGRCCRSGRWVAEERSGKWQRARGHRAWKGS
jgi:hypothetical protein